MKARLSKDLAASLLVLAAVWILHGCNPAPAPQPGAGQSPPRSTPPPPPPAPAAVPAAPAAAEDAEVVGAAYNYDPGGRPDPFRPYLEVARQKEDRSLLPPLQQRGVDELRLIAVVWGKLGSRAMIQTPDGKGYSVGVGTKVGLNNGVVKRITPGEVIIEEQFTDIFGKRQRREVVLRLRPEEGRP